MLGAEGVAVAAVARYFNADYRGGFSRQLDRATKPREPSRAAANLSRTL